MKLHFKNVGRNKVCFTALSDATKITELTDDFLYSLVRPHLISSNVWFGFNEQENIGCIFGGVHCLGYFTVED